MPEKGTEVYFQCQNILSSKTAELLELNNERKKIKISNKKEKNFFFLQDGSNSGFGRQGDQMDDGVGVYQ